MVTNAVQRRFLKIRPEKLLEFGLWEVIDISGVAGLSYKELSK